jgi:hypothetical protein
MVLFWGTGLKSHGRGNPGSDTDDAHGGLQRFPDLIFLKDRKCFSYFSV